MEQKSPLNSYTVIFVLFSHFDPHSFLHARLYSSTPPNSIMRRSVRTMQNTTGCLSMYPEILCFLSAMTDHAPEGVHATRVRTAGHPVFARPADGPPTAHPLGMSSQVGRVSNRTVT